MILLSFAPNFCTQNKLSVLHAIKDTRSKENFECPVDTAMVKRENILSQIKKEVKTRNRFSIKGNAKVKLQQKKLGKQIYLITWLTMWVGMLEIFQNKNKLQNLISIDCKGVQVSFVQ